MSEYEAYQTARVEGFIPADQSFEEYLLTKIKWLRTDIERAISTLRSPPPDDIEEHAYYSEIISFLDGTICHALEILEGKESD